MARCDLNVDFDNSITEFLYDGTGSYSFTVPASPNFGGTRYLVYLPAVVYLKNAAKLPLISGYTRVEGRLPAAGEFRTIAASNWDALLLKDAIEFPAAAAGASLTMTNYYTVGSTLRTTNVVNTDEAQTIAGVKTFSSPSTPGRVTIDPVGFPTLKYSGYALRDVGPAGGWVFYDKGSYSDGWRYLEAAPASVEIEVKWMQGVYNFATGATETGIGTGMRNTQLIVSAIEDSATAMDSYAEAAHSCRGLCYGGVSDWFLPSKDELNLMYTNLYLNGVGGFADGSYWSSSEGYAGSTWGHYFNNGHQTNYSKTTTSRVRAVRAF
jgi:hypothetical protein